MLFRHFLSTRFNVKIGDWNTTKKGELLLNDIWMEDRFKLFETYCLPSVKNQSNQNLTWCIYFDTNTAQVYRNRIKKLADTYPNIHVFFIDSINELRPNLISFINSVKEGYQYIITSRLDTDDLLHEDYIKTVQNLFKPVHNTLIDLRSGYQVSIENNSTEIRNYCNDFNPFISLIEKQEDVKTIFNKMHKDWVNTDKVIIYNKSRLWIELVHNKNKINEANRNLDYSFKFNSNGFGVKGKIEINRTINFYFFFFKKYTKRLLGISKKLLKQTLQLGFGK
jgi:hypothetical protein